MPRVITGLLGSRLPQLAKCLTMAIAAARNAPIANMRRKRRVPDFFGMIGRVASILDYTRAFGDYSIGACNANGIANAQRSRSWWTLTVGPTLGIVAGIDMALPSSV